MGVRFIQAQDHQVTIRSPRIVNECSLTRSILTKNLRSISCRSYIIYQMYEYDFFTTVIIEFDDSFLS